MADKLPDPEQWHKRIALQHFPDGAGINAAAQDGENFIVGFEQPQNVILSMCEANIVCSNGEKSAGKYFLKQESFYFPLSNAFRVLEIEKCPGGVT